MEEIAARREEVLARREEVLARREEVLAQKSQQKTSVNPEDKYDESRGTVSLDNHSEFSLLYEWYVT